MCSLALLLAWGCDEQSFGGSALCNSTAGAEGRLVPDCANPSCQAMEACRVLPPRAIEAAAGATADPPITNPPAVATPEPSPSEKPAESVPTPPSETPHAAPSPPPEQTPADPGCAEQDDCNHEDCAGSDCEAAQPAPATNMVITRISVVLPRSVDGGATCVDPNSACGTYSVSPFLQCGCAPNPVVVVSVDGGQIAETTTSPASDITTWDTQIGIQVDAQSTISLRAFDADGDSRAEILGCDIAGSSQHVATGLITCKKQFPTLAGPTDYSITAAIGPSVN